jgi:transglutaminase-like putative cysteine protease
MMTRTLALALLLLPVRFVLADEKPAWPAERTFEFTYAATVTDLKPGQTARIWLPIPSSSDDQDVEILKTEAPARVALGQEKQYGNRIGYFEQKVTGDRIAVQMVYNVTRREVKGATGTRMKEEARQLERLLQADARVPIDGKPLELLKGKELPEDPMKKARLLYDVVNAHLRYSKEGTGWGRGDSVWACDSKFGNCTDFHSLFISLARSEKIPAKFEIGFPLPQTRGRGEVPGYHCWAFFKPQGKGWVPVDISEASKDPRMQEYYFGNLTADRVAFSTGRDLTLVPKQGGGPVNFLIYPHVEVDGKEVAQERIEKKFRFRDLK